MVLMRLPMPRVNSPEAKARPTPSAVAGPPDSRTSRPRSDEEPCWAAVQPNSVLAPEMVSPPISEADSDPMPLLPLPVDLGKGIDRDVSLSPSHTRSPDSHYEELHTPSTVESRPTVRKVPQEMLPEATQALLARAETSAEHQLAARDTLLDLANAFDTATRANRQNEELLRLERQRSEDLNAAIARLRQELARYEKQFEDMKLREWRERLENSGTVFRSLVSWSRRSMPVNLLGPAGDRQEHMQDQSELGETSTSASSPREEQDQAEERQSTKSPGTSNGAKFGIQNALPTGQLLMAKMALSDGSDADLVMLRWIVKLWGREAKASAEWRRNHREIGTQAEVEDNHAAEERERILRLEVELQSAKAAAAEAEARAVAAERREASTQEKVVKLEEELHNEQRRLRLSKEEQAELHRKLSEALERHDSERQRSQDELQQLRNQVQQLAADRDNQVEELRKLLQEQEERLTRDRAAWEAEKKALQATVAQITAELQDAVTQARRISLQAKRKDGGNPEEFVDLIAELASMRERLAALTKDYLKEKDASHSLQRRLQKTSRNLELERQFLPLRHTVRGPIGQLNASASANTLSPGFVAAAQQKPQHPASWGGGRSLLASAATRILT